MTYADGHPFHRSGQAALSDLNTAEWIALFARLEREAERFRQHESSFRSPEYPWPRDPLHDWSRCWEYPYAYYHLERFIQHAPAASRPVVVDVGSGVTFFPFALGTLGYDVVCTDTDPICRTDLERAVPLVSAAPGRVSFRMIEQGRLPLSDGEAGVATCISVLEHIPDFESTVRELARVVRPGGLAVLTNDLDLRGRSRDWARALPGLARGVAQTLRVGLARGGGSSRGLVAHLQWALPFRDSARDASGVVAVPGTGCEEDVGTEAVAFVGVRPGCPGLRLAPESLNTPPVKEGLTSCSPSPLRIENCLI